MESALAEDTVPASLIEHVVLLVPGIRDHGGWTQNARDIFEVDPKVRAFRMGHGFYNALFFLAPGDKSQEPYEKLVNQYAEAKKEFKNAQISIVAHSFGTYLVGRLLREYSCDRLCRVILCGSVLRPDYDWSHVRRRFQSDGRVLNQCGFSDYWPAFAGLLRKRYGPAGRYGFEHIYPQNRWFLGGHSLFFKNQHMEAWPDFVKYGRVADSNCDMPQPTALGRLCATLPGPVFLLRTFLTVIWACLWWFPWTVAITFIVCLLFYLSWGNTKTVDVDTFYRTWSENSTPFMHSEYVGKPTTLTGTCVLESGYPVTTEYRLQRPKPRIIGDKPDWTDDEKFGWVTVTPRTPIPPEKLSPGTKVKFSGRLLSVTEHLGVQVDQADVTVITGAD